MTDSASLSICGDVERPAHLALTELRSLTDAEVVADFHCREGWIEVTRHPQQATAATIALARLEQ
jgi:DMSO/TMAO reductase YedYZ molybdopterin-dependent catalytic subunit